MLGMDTQFDAKIPEQAMPVCLAQSGQMGEFFIQTWLQSYLGGARGSQSPGTPCSCAPPCQN